MRILLTLPEKLMELEHWSSQQESLDSTLKEVKEWVKEGEKKCSALQAPVPIGSGYLLRGSLDALQVSVFLTKKIYSFMPTSASSYSIWALSNNSQNFLQMSFLYMCELELKIFDKKIFPGECKSGSGIQK